MSNIAPLSEVSNSFDTFAKLLRVMEKEGATSEQLALPINDLKARENLARFLAAGCKTPEGLVRRFEPFAKCETGGKSGNHLAADLRAAGFKDTTFHYLEGFNVFDVFRKEKVRFACEKVRNLGFTETPTTRNLTERIGELGHQLCHPFEAAHLRLHLKDLPLATFLVVLTSGYSDSKSVTCHINQDGLGASSINFFCYASKNYLWDLDVEVVFRINEFQI